MDSGACPVSYDSYVSLPAEAMIEIDSQVSEGCHYGDPIGALCRVVIPHPVYLTSDQVLIGVFFGEGYQLRF